ncbi:hypothetical protein EXE58_11720 [Nocardioides seonyuensis]|uniref:PKD domain-containing protein n=1 Tax=Nocardioides seonyuensis TaxID=2518371 RepID=A0A4P7IFL0_9ACTN|nr:hypothetical protein [Nocardioides seonyuensis]QBX56064.1 hypothetical protein EXE58_11720 [Nocardioides seonyuensis]
MSNGVPGFMYAVSRDGVQVGMTCAPTDVAPGPSREQVLQSFKELQWPSSTAVVQPGGGQTLVNLETIFYTTNAAPTSKTVSIAKTDVQIIATPVSYTWSFGDGTTLSTTTPGAPHPSREVTHVYTSTDDVEASVATTYSGTYKIGNGDWQDLGETHTVPGPVTELEVLEAKPQLVLR